MIVIDVESIEGVTERREFPGPKVTIGRSPENDIAVALRRRPGVHGAAVSNCATRHGTLLLRDGKLWLFDMGTANGWHVLNEGMVAPHRYKDGYPIAVGDRYYVGDTKITIVSF